MVKFFSQKKNGYVTVMLIVMLISVLFLNTTFIELGRYRAISNIYGEIQENAAFSLLANYDRELYKTFGLLAVEDDIDTDKLVEYVKSDLNAGESSEAKRIDKYGSLDEAAFNLEKLYFLSQKDVFETQVNEFCAYRAPIAIVNEGMNLEETLNALIENLESSLTGLESFKNFTEKANKTVDTYQCMIDFVDEVEEEYKPAIESMTDAATKLKEAIDRREEIRDTIASIEAQISEAESSEDGGGIDVATLQKNLEGLKSQLEQQYKTIEKAASDLKQSIEQGKTANKQFKESYKNFNKKFKDMRDSDIEGSLEGAKSDEDLSGLATQMQETGKESQEKTGVEIGKISVVIGDEDIEVDEYYAIIDEEMDEDIIQLEEVDGESFEMIDFDLTNPYNTNLNGQLDSSTNGLKDLKADAEDDLKDANEEDTDGDGFSLKDFIETLKLIVKIMTNSGPANLDYDENLTVEIPELGNVENPFSEEDEAYYSKMIEDVEQSLNIAVNTFNNPGNDPALTALERALNNFHDKSERLKDAFNNADLGTINLVKMLKQLADLLSAVLDFFVAAIEAITALIAKATSELMNLIYSRTFAATYAVEMFTNRSSDVEKDVRMNGSSFTDYGDDTGGEVFKMANAEYIYGGNKSEIANQSLAYMSIFGLRLLANIPAILSDSGLRSFSEMLAAIPIVGPVLSIVVYVLIILAESYLDMLFMIYGEEGVPIVKTKGYLNFEGKGIKELKTQLKSVADNVGLSSGKSKSDSDTKKLKDKFKGSLSDAKDGLFKWRYKEHLFLVLCLFKTTDSLYKHEAELIQIQMDKAEEEEFRLSNMATYVRTKGVIKYRPLLPVPYYGDGIPIGKLYYTGY